MCPSGPERGQCVNCRQGENAEEACTEVKHIHVDEGVPRRERYFWDVLFG